MDNSNGSIHTFIVDLFRNMGDELFSAHHLTYAHGTMDEPTKIADECFLSVLGASAEGIKILCHIRFSAEVGEHICRAKNVIANVDNLRDMCGELNNQLVGKVKNRLLAHQCCLMLGLPTLLCGRDLIATCPPQAALATHTYTSAAGTLDVVVHSIIHADYSIADQPDEALVGAAGEGELDFF